MVLGMIVVVRVIAAAMAVVVVVRHAHGFVWREKRKEVAYLRFLKHHKLQEAIQNRKQTMNLRTSLWEAETKRILNILEKQMNEV